MSPQVYNHTRDVLHKAVDRVYGSPKYNDPDFDKAYRLKENLSRFAAFKTAEQSDLLSAASDMDEAHIINRRYNVNYLRTEYVHAVRGSRAAKNWERIQADKDLYPNLKYMPSTAAEPRNDHKRLYGMVRPVDDAFWKEWFPPNDWGCLCRTEQVGGEAKSSAMPKGMKAPPPVMRNNPGISGKLMPDSHPMIKRIKNKEKVEKQGAALELKIMRKDARETLKGMKLTSADGYNIAVSNTGIDEVINQPHKQYHLKLDIVKQLPLVLKNATYVSSAKPDANIRDKNIVQFHYYAFVMAGKSSYLVIKELNTGERILYSVVDRLKK